LTTAARTHGPARPAPQPTPSSTARTAARVIPFCASCPTTARTRPWRSSRCARRASALDSGDRRYHANPMLPVCGPHVELQDSLGRRSDHAAAIARAADALHAGRIVAVKASAVFICWSTPPTTTSCASCAAASIAREKTARSHVSLARGAGGRGRHSPTSNAGCSPSPAAPIVLDAAARRYFPCRLRRPGNPWIGAMLPYAPLHVLAAGQGQPARGRHQRQSVRGAALHRRPPRPSSGLAASPICFSDTTAASRAQWTTRSCALCATGPLLLRRARGYAPTRPPAAGRPARRATAVRRRPHEKHRRRDRWRPPRAEPTHPAIWATPSRPRPSSGRWICSAGSTAAGLPASPCDAHPDYASTRFAEKLGVPVVRVQHHLAHILACLPRQRRPPRPGARRGMGRHGLRPATARFGAASSFSSTGRPARRAAWRTCAPSSCPRRDGRARAAPRSPSACCTPRSGRATRERFRPPAPWAWPRNAVAAARDRGRAA